MLSQTAIQNLKLTTHQIKLAGTPYSSLKHLIPDSANSILQYELTSTNHTFVNGLRRAIMSEIPVRYLTVSMADIMTTDPWIDADIIRKRIEMIPIPQSTPIGTTYALVFENKSDTYVDVMSAHIKQRGTVVKGIDQGIPICSINSTYSISISNITVAETYGYLNSRAAIGRVGMEVLNYDMENTSSSESDIGKSDRSPPTHFGMVIEMPGNMHPKEHVIKAIDSICNRLDLIDYSSAKIEFDVYKLPILNETHTIGNLLSTYIYAICPSISYVAMREEHPSKRQCAIDIVHPQAEELCKQAVIAIKKEFQAIKPAFK